MTQIQEFFEETRTIRHVTDPASVPCFRSVEHVWHFPSGDVLLDRTERRDCLLSDVECVDVPASDCHRIGEAVVLDIDTTVRATDDAGSLKLTEFDRTVIL